MDFAYINYMKIKLKISIYYFIDLLLFKHLIDNFDYNLSQYYLILFYYLNNF